MIEYSPEEAISAAGPWTHRDIAANGARFHAVTAGDGPLVVLLHGFPMYWWTWRSLVPTLTDAGYRVAAIDLRGYGGSDHPPRGYDLFTLSKDVAAIIRSLGDPSAAVIGHGMGGMLGWTAAALEPESVNRLVAISAPHPVRMRESLLGDRAQLAAMSYIVGFQRPLIPERQLTRNDAERVDAFLRRWSGDPAWPDEEASAHFRAAFQVNATAHCALEYYRWAVRSIPRADGRRFKSDMTANLVSCPVLQIHGAQDRSVLPRSALGSNKFTAGPYAWRSMPNVGHFPHEEAVAATNGLIVDWLTSDPPWNDPPPAPDAQRELGTAHSADESDS